MKLATIQLETLTCPSCLMKINKTVRSLKGVNKKSVDVMFNSSRVRVEFDEELLNVKDIEDAISNLGYEVLRSQVK